MVTTSTVLAQRKKSEAQNFFGFQYRPLIPLGLVGDRPFDIDTNSFKTTVSSRLGYNYGGVVRIGLNKNLAIETGLSYTKRNFNLDFSVADSNVVGKNTVGIINYDIPVNLLAYIQLGQQAFMNASLGGSLNFYPSNVQTRIVPSGKHMFIFEGRRFAFFNTDVNGNVGFEYRTERSGIFYVGISGKLPIQPIFWIASEYRHDTYRLVGFDQIDGATFSIDLKYFFHKPPQRGIQYKPGPIEQ